LSNFFENNSPEQPFIKVCGVSNVHDAEMCAKLGIDAIGIILTKPWSTRKLFSDRLTIEEAKKLIEQIDNHLKVIVLIHSEILLEISRIIQILKPDAIQFRDNITPTDLILLRQRHPEVSFIKVLSIDNSTSVADAVTALKAIQSQGILDGVILDSLKGGSGQTHNWELSTQIIKSLPTIPILLAGGISAENVRAALEKVKPIGIDVMSSLNSQKRSQKDHKKLKEFATLVKRDKKND